MTEPEQWAVELWNRAADAADGCATQSFGDDAKAAALTIQRAFEERERKLREAGEVLRREAALLHQNAIGCARNHYGCDFELHGMPQWLVDTGARIFTASKALKETPDAG